MKTNHFYESSDECEIKHSRIYGGSILGRSTVYGSTVADNASIHDFGAAIRSEIVSFSRIRGNAQAYDSCMLGQAEISGNAQIHNTVMADLSLVSDKARVFGSFLEQFAQVRDEAVVRNVILTGQAVVKGNARVIRNFDHQIEIGGGTIIHEGVWIRAPRSVTVPEVGFSVTECVEGKVIINCTCVSEEKWRRAGRRYGRKLGMTDREIDLIEDAVNQVTRGRK